MVVIYSKSNICTKAQTWISLSVSPDDLYLLPKCAVGKGRRVKSSISALSGLLPVLAVTYSHSDNSESQYLLRWILLPLSLDLVPLGKVIPHPSTNLHIKDARLSKPRRHIFQLDKLVWSLLSRNTCTWHFICRILKTNDEGGAWGWSHTHSIAPYTWWH